MYNNHAILTPYMYNKTGGMDMAYKQEWHRETRDSINTGFRIPKALYHRFQCYQEDTGMNKTDIMIAALEAYLPHYETEGGSEE